MRTYSTLTKKQLVDWLNNFNDDSKIVAFDYEGRTVERIELSEEPLVDAENNYQVIRIALSIKGRTR
jgi:hypothetical protein